jgi:hypothetical protein
LNPGETIFSIHLWVICSDPQPHDGSVVAFNLTSKDWDSDTNCIIQVGEHSFVRHDSVIAYEHGNLFTPDHIRRLKLLAPKEYGAVSPELLLRIQRGAIDSHETPKHLKTIIRTILGLP